MNLSLPSQCLFSGKVRGYHLKMLTCLQLLLGQDTVFSALLSQKPHRDICQRGTSVTIHCEVDIQFTLMFWYHQLPGQSLVLMATTNQGLEATYEHGFTKDKFPISRPTLVFSTMTVSNVSLEDSSFYFCSAGDTVLSTDQRSEQEPQPAPSCLAPTG
uniref:Ig-like domain-containing protein n=1 Tax=Lynx canadensis TaxID=61383 RepID=A0A667IHA6_LYNCA